MRMISALVLAAGLSKRMGCGNKSLLPLGNKPVIRWILETMLEAGLDEVVVVLGPTGRQIAAQLGDLPLSLAWNTAPDGDMAASVRTGLAKVGDKAEGLLICPADHPLVTPATIRTLLSEWRRQPEKIAIPAYRGRKGHPVLFPRTVLAELGRHSTMRELVRLDPGRQNLVAVADEGVLLDMDTPAEYSLMQARVAPS